MYKIYLFYVRINSSLFLLRRILFSILNLYSLYCAPKLLSQDDAYNDSLTFHPPSAVIEECKSSIDSFVLTRTLFSPQRLRAFGSFRLQTQKLFFIGKGISCPSKSLTKNRRFLLSVFR